MIKRTILLILTCVFAGSCFFAGATDIGNSTGSSGSIPGSASPGNAAYGANQNWTMWKISVYVGKETKTAKTEEEAGKLSLDSLSKDYYKFGNTYWLYRNETSICYRNGLKTSDLKKRFWVATNNKEEYVNDINNLLSDGISPGGKLSYNMSSIDSLEERVFDASKIDFETDIIGNVSMPYVRNIGSVDGMVGDDFDEQVDVFFNQSKHNWNVLINLAALASGKTGSSAYLNLLQGMVSKGKFTQDGTKITNYNLVNPYRKLNSDGKYEKESSLVAWVIVYEPVIIFYKEIDWFYHYFAMTASDASAAFISGQLNLTNESGFSKSTCLKNSFYAPGNVNSLVSFNFASPFFINLASSVVPSKNWFGYELLSKEDYSASVYNGNKYIFVDSVLKKCGVGFRYQASNAVPSDTICDLTCEFIKPQSLYKEGYEVITSAYIYNEGNMDVVPDKLNSVRFDVFCYDNGSISKLLTLTKDNAIIPQNEKNIVYFKWLVPGGMEGKILSLQVYVDSNNKIIETNEKNNSNTMNVLVTKQVSSKTENTKYEDKTPNTFSEQSPPNEYSESSTWNEWVFVEDKFCQLTYGITYNLNSIVKITVEEGNKTAVFDSIRNKWQIKSGYGFFVEILPQIIEKDGYYFPQKNAYTGCQIISVDFPEYMYDETLGKYDTLVNDNDVFSFQKNSDKEGDNAHYIPIWFRDGNYVFTIIYCECWTPMGIIKRSQNVLIEIEGNLYDDWFVN